MTKEILRIILFFILIFPLYATMGLSQEQVIVSSKVGECSLSVESDENSHTLRLRAHHPQYKPCQIDRDAISSILKAAFSKTEAPKLEGSYSSLSIGRLIDYPWLSQHLATSAYRDRGWDSKKGKPIAMDENKYVSTLLSRKELMIHIESFFENSGYRVVGVMVQKVLIGTFREIPLYQGEIHSGKVPYDAQVWFRLGTN